MSTVTAAERMAVGLSEPSQGEAARWAARTFVQAAPGAAALVGCAASPGAWLDFARIYAMFRVWDDRVDAPGGPAAGLRAEMVAEAAWRAAGCVAPQTAMRRAVADALAGPRGEALGRATERMWSALVADLGRERRALPEAWLAGQAARVGDAYAQALWTCAGEAGAVSEAACALARAATRAHWVRDLELDLGLGYVNVSAERCAELGLDAERPVGAGLARWAEGERARWRPVLLAGASGARGWRARMVFVALGRKYARC